MIMGTTMTSGILTGMGVALALAAGAQAEPVAAMRLVAAQQAVTVLYPAVVTGRWQWRASEGTDGAVLLEAVPAPEASADLRARTAPRPPALMALVRVDAAGGVTSLTCSGPLTGEAARRAARARVKDGVAPLIVLRDARAVATGDGALRPLAALVRRVPGLSGLTITSTRLVAEAIEWDVAATAPDGVGYIVRVDPIGGHVLALARQGGAR
jgi:hypothetical protein